MHHLLSCWLLSRLRGVFEAIFQLPAADGLYASLCNFGEGHQDQTRAERRGPGRLGAPARLAKGPRSR